MRKLFSLVIAVTFFSLNSLSAQQLWKLAKENRDVLTFSTLFIAQDVRDFIATPAGLDKAVGWCKETGITRVFIEAFRGGYYADKDALIRAKERFLKEGFDVAGCVTTVNVGKDGIGGWNTTPCFTSQKTIRELEHIFEYTASVFDLIMIDDFLFNECECEDCIRERGDQPWSKYRMDKMVEVSREHILKPARLTNPNVKIIVKYPLWYDQFHERGYEVVRETEDFDFIWVGTETRDYDYAVRPGGEVQYNAFFIMRWLGGIGGDKTGGGWVDALGTMADTYLEQARQTILGNAKEIMLFHYGGLQDEKNDYDGKPGTPIADVAALRKEMPGLFTLARTIHEKPLRGIHMPKLPSSEAYEEKYIFSFFGMLGLPLVPDHTINTSASSAIFTVHALKEPGFSGKLRTMLDAGRPVLITDGLAKRLSNQVLLENPNLLILKTDEDPKTLLTMSRQELKMIRDKMMAPTGFRFDAPEKVALYLLGDNLVVIENFNDSNVDVSLQLPAGHTMKKVLTLPVAGSADITDAKTRTDIKNISKRSLVAFEY